MGAESKPDLSGQTQRPKITTGPWGRNTNLFVFVVVVVVCVCVCVLLCLCSLFIMLWSSVCVWSFMLVYLLICFLLQMTLTMEPEGVCRN